MISATRIRLHFAAIVLGLTIAWPAVSNATIVEFDTNFGAFQVNLYDLETPATVANFLAYVQDGDYSNSIIHRSVAGFIIQGGAVITDVDGNLAEIVQRPSVQNEPDFANVRGTIAMAKLPNDPDSATSQWFFNLSDNSANLDNQNGGFTVFGEVIDNGMTVVDAITTVPVFTDTQSGLTDIPLQNFTASPPVRDNYVIINSITVIDTTVDSAAGLNPTPTTRGNDNGGGTNLNGGGGGGGALGFVGLFGLLVLGWRRYRILQAA